MEEAEAMAERQRTSRGDRGEGFITKDLLLLPGGGEALERATALHTWGARLSDAQTSMYPEYMDACM